MLQHLVFILFFFVLGSCVGSFLNVVVWRLPRIQQDPDDHSLFGPFLKTIEGLSNPPSHCPKCGNKLKWYDNLPVVGWIKLGGKCRFCRQPISVRYPIVEAICGLLFVFYYVMFFIAQVGPCAAQPQLVLETTLLGGERMVPRPLLIQLDWPVYGLYMALVAALLAASLIDAELFIIPVEIPWALAATGIVAHAIIDKPSLPGALNASFTPGALAAGGAIGLLVSVILFLRGAIPQSYPDGEPMQDVGPADEPPPPDPAWVRAARHLGRYLLPLLLFTVAAWLVITQRPAVMAAGLIVLAIAVGLAILGRYPAHPPDPAGAPPPTGGEPTPPPRQWGRGELAREMGKELLFLAPPTILATIFWLAATFVFPHAWEKAMTYHWLSGLLGAVLGALVGAAVVWVTRILGTLGFGRLAMGLGDVHLMFGVGAVVGAGGATVAFFLAPFFGIVIAVWMLLTGTKRELPYGPYLSLATAAVLLFGCPILAWLTPGATGLLLYIQDLFHAGSAG
jgi:prepilin signal peptidase PulO-like enzyme (type II secretory pathway)